MQNFKGVTCYLAGPVELVDDCESWRNQITPVLKDLGIKVWNPIIKPDWFNQSTRGLSVEQQRSDKAQLHKMFCEDYDPMMLEEELGRNDLIRSTCLRLASCCDFIICRVSGLTIGTFEEICVANQQGKPILFWGDGKLDSCWRAAQFGRIGVWKEHKKIWFNSISDIADHLKDIDTKVNNGDLTEDENLDWIFLKGGWPC